MIELLALFIATALAYHAGSYQNWKEDQDELTHLLATNVAARKELEDIAKKLEDFATAALAYRAGNNYSLDCFDLFGQGVRKN